MNDPKITSLQKNVDTQRTIDRNHNSSSNHKKYQTTRNKLKKTIKETKVSFLCKHFLTNNQLKFGILCIEY